MTDAETVFGWAQLYFQSGDYVNARKWYAKRVEIDGADPETFLAKHRLAVSMHKLGELWPEVQDAYLQAWAFCPARAEPLHAVAREYRSTGRYHLGYLFARRAAALPPPAGDQLAVDAEVYTWRALDELAVCAAWIGKKAEAFNLCRELIALPTVPESARERIAKNRDFEVPTMLETTTVYSETMVNNVGVGGSVADVTVSLIARSDRTTVERTLNSFLSCCQDRSLIQRFLVLDTGLSNEDRQALCERYRFIEVIQADPHSSPGDQLRELRSHVAGRFWLHLGYGWQFFASDKLISRLKAVLVAEPQVFQVGVNIGDVTELVGKCAPESAVHRAVGTGRYVRASAIVLGPAMFDTFRLDQASTVMATHADCTRELDGMAFRTATLDEVLCTVHA